MELDSIEKRRIERELRRALKQKELGDDFSFSRKRKINDELDETQEEIIKQTEEIEKLEHKLKKKLNKVEKLVNKEKKLISILKKDKKYKDKNNIKWDEESIDSFWTETQSEENTKKPLSRAKKGKYGDLSYSRESVSRSRGPCKGYGPECHLCTDYLAKNYMLYLKDDWDNEKKRLKNELSDKEYDRAESCSVWLE